MQDQAWFLQKLVPDSPAYNVHRAYRITGELDVADLRSAWRSVVRRHEVLRTTLVEIDGLPVQEIAADYDMRTFANLRAPSRQAAERLCAELAATPFDLDDGPLARLFVIRTGAGQNIVLLLLHEAVADDGSVSILVNELSECYTALADGRALDEALPALPAQYADYARWQRDQTSTLEFHRLLDWWVSALKPPPSSPALPTDRTRPAGPSFDGGRVPFDWGDDLGRSVAGLARAEGTTPATVLLAAFQCLLRRHSGENRVVVGSRVGVRPSPAFTGLIGPFSNQLVLCADLPAGATFREVVHQVARVTGEAYDHRELPFDRLVHALKIDRDPRRIPMCDVMFTYRDEPEPVLGLGGTMVRAQPVETGVVKTDLTLAVDGTGSTLAGSLAYRSRLFEERSARLLLEQLHTLLLVAVRAPDLPVDTIPLEDPARMGEMVRAADRTTEIDPELRAVNELVHRVARRDPRAAALAWDGEAVSYRELEALAAGVTGGLRALGGVEGASVVVRMPPGPRQVATLLGILDAGGYVTCLGTGDVGERGQTMLAELRPACVVLDGGAAEDDLIRWYASELNGRVLDLAGLPGGAVPKPRAAGGALDRRAYVAYTSGSTGKPKGIAQSHGTLAQFATWMAAEFRMRPGARVAQWAAPGYDAALCETFAALVGGATLCPVPDRIRANPEKVIDWLVAERITLLQTVPSFARKLLDVVRTEGSADRLGALDHLLLAGEPFPAELAGDLRESLPAVRLVNLYGATETILATWHEVTGPVSGMVPIGGPIPGRHVMVLDEWDRPCPTGVTGQIVVRSPYVTLGYVGVEESTRAFEPVRHLEASGRGTGRFYRTGDLGRRRWDGLLEFRGRADAQIKFHGTRVELAEVEAALALHDSVGECALVATTGSDGWVTRLVAYIVPSRTEAGEAVVSASALRATLRRRFGKATLPVSVKTVEVLPRNVGGKIDRGRLATATAGAASARSARTPETPVEVELAAIWTELLGVAPENADDTFFVAGGHSLLVPRLLDRIRERFGVEVPLWEFFANPTLTGLVAQVRAHVVSTEAVTQPMTG
ncbi:condensation domain-containing protein [Streptosporangium soli]|nr:condensation domain-containing protein [Streptosporangium sp. KLBMP 9127]